VKASRSANQSTLSRIIAQVEQALASHSQLERTVDRVARLFVPCVVLLSLLTFAFTWINGTATLGYALMRAITVLVIACPCALGMATPMAITAALGWASRHGIFVRDSRVLETVRNVDTLILDKTGTVTEGRFALLDVALHYYATQHAVAMALHNGDEDQRRTPFFAPSPAHETENDVLSVMASLEQYSEHPLGRAVMDAARDRGIHIRDADAVEVLKGMGITGSVERRNAFVGNRRLLRQIGADVDPDLELQASTWEAEGKTVSFIGWDGEVQAAAAFGDRLKPEAIALVRELQKSGIELRIVSGDSMATTKWVAVQLGIDHFESEVLPDQKARAVRDLQQRGAVVAMIGDGVNDAPALAQADLGIAMGSGTDIAMKAAAVVLMNASLARIPDVFALAQKTIRIVRQNLFWAFFYNVIGISLAVAGVLNPIMAAFAMLLSSLSVVGNSMRLTRQSL
jgi:heavy metal translocating P-type ATPase